MGVSSPPSGAAGEVSSRQSHEVLGLKSSRITAAKTKIESSFLVLHFAFHLNEVSKAAQHINDLVRIVLAIITVVVVDIPGVSERGHDEKESEEHAARQHAGELYHFERREVAAASTIRSTAPTA